MPPSRASDSAKILKLAASATATFKKRPGQNEPTAAQAKTHDELLKNIHHPDAQVREAVVTALALGAASEHFSWNMVAKLGGKHAELREIVEDKKEQEQTRFAAAALMCEVGELLAADVKPLIGLLDGRDLKRFGELGKKFYDTLTCSGPKAAPVLARQFEGDHANVCKAMKRHTFYAAKALPKMLELATHADAKVRAAFEDLVVAVGKKDKLPDSVRAVLKGPAADKAKPVDWGAVNLAAEECVLKRTPFTKSLARLRKMCPDDAGSPLWDLLNDGLFEQNLARCRTYIDEVFKRPPPARINVLEFRIILPAIDRKRSRLEDVMLDGGAGFDPRKPEEFESGEFGGEPGLANLDAINLVAQHADTSKLSFEMSWVLNGMITGMLAERICRERGADLLAGGADVRYIRYGYSDGETLLGAVTRAGWQCRKPGEKEEAFRATSG